MEYETLLNEAFEAMKSAYAPYSNYHVGAAVLTTDGKYFRGANIENASFGATNCAERSAVFGAYSYGYRKDTIAALAIVSDGPRIAAPCGICRQVLCELIEHKCPIVLSNKKETLVTNIDELLPLQFSGEDLDK